MIHEAAPKIAGSPGLTPRRTPDGDRIGLHFHDPLPPAGRPVPMRLFKAPRTVPGEREVTRTSPQAGSEAPGPDGKERRRVSGAESSPGGPPARKQGPCRS